jgi:hypothetical protein
MNYIITSLTAALAAFECCVYIPMVSYLGNVNEFYFDGSAILMQTCIAFPVVWLALFLLLTATGVFSSKVEIFFGRRMVTVTRPAVWLIILCGILLIEGSLLGYRLPQITGEPGLFLSRKRLAADGLLLLTGLYMGLFQWKKLAGKPHIVMAALLVFMLAGLGDAWRNREMKVPVSVHRNTVIDNLAFHPKKNVIVIVSDAFPTDVAERVLAENPDLAAEFTGFTLLRNNLAPGGQTSYAVPAILQGRPYSGGSYAEFARKALSDPDSLPQSLHASGYSVYTTSLLPRFCRIMTQSDFVKQDLSFKLTPRLFVELSFRFIPYIFKEYTADFLFAHAEPSKPTGGNTSGTPAKGSDPKKYSIFEDDFFRSALIPSFSRHSPEPTLHFHHLVGTHQPFVKDRNGLPLPAEESNTVDGLFRSGEYVINQWSTLLKALKYYNMYDESIIVFIGDHGDPIRKNPPASFMFPVFMIKSAYASDIFEISKAPFSSNYLPSLLLRLLEEPNALKTYLEKLPSSRLWFQQPDTMVYVDGIDRETLKFTFAHIDVSQHPTTLLPKTNYTFRRSDDVFNIAVPVYSKNINLAGGSGADFRPIHNEPGVLHFKVAAEKHRSVTVTMDISLFNLTQKLNVDICSLSVYDINSKLNVYDNYIQRGEAKNVTFNALVSGNNEICLSFSSNLPIDHYIMVFRNIMFD